MCLKWQISSLPHLNSEVSQKIHELIQEVPSMQLPICKSPAFRDILPNPKIHKKYSIKMHNMIILSICQFQSPNRIAGPFDRCFRDIFPKQHSMIVCAHNLSLMLPAEQKTHISHPSSLLPPCGNSRASLGAGLPWATRWIDPSELHHLGALSLVRWMAGTGRDVEPHQGRRLWSWMPLDQRHGDHGYAALPGPKPNCSPLTLRPCSKHEFYGHQRLPVDWN